MTKWVLTSFSVLCACSPQKAETDLEGDWAVVDTRTGQVLSVQGLSVRSEGGRVSLETVSVAGNTKFDDVTFEKRGGASLIYFEGRDRVALFRVQRISPTRIGVVDLLRPNGGLSGTYERLD